MGVLAVLAFISFISSSGMGVVNRSMVGIWIVVELRFVVDTADDADACCATLYARNIGTLRSMALIQAPVAKTLGKKRR